MTSRTSVIVDADACPLGAMEVLYRLRREYEYRMVTVASFHHHVDVGEEGEEHVTVGDGPDEADRAVVNRTRPGDVVVTNDRVARSSQRGPLPVSVWPRVHPAAHGLSVGRTPRQGQAPPGPRPDERTARPHRR